MPVTMDRTATAYDTSLQEVRSDLAEYLANLWDELSAPVLLGRAALSTVVGMIDSTVTAAQLNAADLTSAYLADATNSRTARVDSESVTTRRGTSKAVVYQRPFRQMAIEVAKGNTRANASRAGLRRLHSISSTDVQMAVVRQSQTSMRAAGRKYFRRIPTGRESCAMCLIAATQRYKTEDLLPIHPGCDCVVGPIPAGMDLDSTIDVKMLNDTHQQVKAFAGIADRGGRMPDYRDLIVSHEHGEIGPVIGWRNQKFTGPDDLRNNGIPAA